MHKYQLMVIKLEAVSRGLLFLFSHEVVYYSLRPPWTAAHQALMSFAIFQSWLKFMSIELVMLSSHPASLKLVIWYVIKMNMGLLDPRGSNAQVYFRIPWEFANMPISALTQQFHP